VVIYGIASQLSRDVEDFYDTRAAAEEAAATVVREAPELTGLIYVTAIDLDQLASADTSLCLN
jgi:hypothetical protein